jgi:drug/metabolite transporter (DMT)-like permease
MEAISSLRQPTLERKPPYLWTMMALGIASISSAAVLIKLCRAGPLAVAFYRLGLASLMLWPAFISQRGWRSFDGKKLAGALLSGFFLAMHFGLWLYSLEYTTVASSVVLVTLNPLFVGLLGWLFLGERVSWRLGAAIVLVIAGGLLIGGGALQAGGRAMAGNLLALGGALMASLYLLAGRRLRQGLGVVGYSTVCYTATSLILLAAGLAAGERLWGFDGRTWGLFLALALGPQILGHTVFNWGLRFLPASRIAMMIVAEPIGATVLAFLLLGQAPTPGEIAGGILILGAVYLSATAA